LDIISRFGLNFFCKTHLSIGELFGQSFKEGLKRFLLLVLNFPLSRAEHLRCNQIEVRGLFEPGVAYAQAWIPYFNGFWTPAFAGVTA
jgi:hypothetical protein